MYNESVWTLTLATLGASKRAVSSAVSSPSPVIPGFAGTARFTFRVLSSGLAAVALLDARRRREPSNFERLSGRRNGGPRRRSDFGHHSFLCRRGLELQLAAVLHGQGSHWLPPCGPTPASHPLRVAKRSPKTSFWVLLLAHDLLEPPNRQLKRRQVHLSYPRLMQVLWKLKECLLDFRCYSY